MNKPAEENCQCERPIFSSIHPLRYLSSFFIRNNSFSSGFIGHRNHSGNNCTVPQMNCFRHDSDHWKTPPFWPPELGSFCFCTNVNNNSYWCLRTFNATHNFLYCEFVTGFLSYYDLNEDPDQLTNTIFQLNSTTLTQLNQQLILLKSCKSGAECEHYSSAHWNRPLKPKEESVNNIELY